MSIVTSRSFFVFDLNNCDAEQWGQNVKTCVHVQQNKTQSFIPVTSHYISGPVG
jgi:hypothetical protein